ncbi:MAG: hypothetical protein LBT22_07635 [Peptococcaceae bacterium]|jgi:hypothetical protein|nr:hypothetical protein [Peptococcaceae bacterium]
MQAIGILLLLVGVAGSVYQRRYMSMWRSAKLSDSPLSRALAQLVGTAGGIYLSLELLFSFLKLPEEWRSDTPLMMEPLALISLVLAILQPYGLRGWYWLRNIRR